MRHTLAAAALGQLLACLIAGTAVASTSLVQQGVSAPTLQSALNYLLLAVVYTAARLRTSGWRLKCRWWAYAILALLDVEANFCVVLAYRYTSLTSVTLLDCFTIPVAVALSTVLLGATYRRGHYFGAGICIAGLCVLVATDRTGSAAGGAGSGSPLLGDALVLLGAALYALCNVLQEWLLGDVPVPELLGMLGLFGCVWSAAQGIPLELSTLRAAQWTPSVALPFVGFAACMFAFYSLVPLELSWGGAALLNISLLASDLWAALARYFFFGGFQGSSLLFFGISLAIVAAGIALFTWSGDVDTQLGAGSSLATTAPTGGPGGLPVVYHRVSTGAGEAGQPRLPLPSLSSSGKGAGRAALEALQAVTAAGEQQQQQGGQQQQQQRNPFDVAVPALRNASVHHGSQDGAAEGGRWPVSSSPTAAVIALSSSPRTPAMPVPLAAAASSGIEPAAVGLEAVGEESGEREEGWGERRPALDGVSP